MTAMAVFVQIAGGRGIVAPGIRPGCLAGKGCKRRRGLPIGPEGARGGWVFEPNRQPLLLLAGPP